MLCRDRFFSHVLHGKAFRKLTEILCRSILGPFIQSSLMHHQTWKDSDYKYSQRINLYFCHTRLKIKWSWFMILPIILLDICFLMSIIMTWINSLPKQFFSLAFCASCILKYTSCYFSIMCLNRFQVGSKDFFLILVSHFHFLKKTLKITVIFFYYHMGTVA